MEKVTLNITCELCGRSYEVTVNSKDLKNYNNGMLIHRAFPYLSPDERELLISHICGECFDKMFEDEE